MDRVCFTAEMQEGEGGGGERERERGRGRGWWGPDGLALPSARKKIQSKLVNKAHNGLFWTRFD
jgi:hypothetical protein